MREYRVVIGGLPHTVQLSDADAERLGDRAVPVDTKQARPPKNKARKPRNKAVKDDDAG